jgi:tyrosyl-tRNA synthetase
MQCTDVFFLKADVCQLGVDQRKVNMLAREYCDSAKIKFKPVILSHHMLYGLKKGQEKMSKSDPDSAIFMEDTPEDVERKINAAYCPRTVEGAVAAAVDEDDAGKESMQLVKDDLKNPCLDYIKHIVLCPAGSSFAAGGTLYTDFAVVRADFLDGRLSEADLKTGLIAAINRILEPVRAHFLSNAGAKELLEKVKKHFLRLRYGSFCRSILLRYMPTRRSELHPRVLFAA